MVWRYCTFIPNQKRQVERDSYHRTFENVLIRPRIKVIRHLFLLEFLFHRRSKCPATISTQPRCSRGSSRIHTKSKKTSAKRKGSIKDGSCRPSFVLRRRKLGKQGF